MISGGRRNRGTGEDTIFSRNFLNTPEVPGAKDGVAWAVRHFGADRVFFISKVRSPVVRSKTVRWLEHVEFWRRTNALPEHLTFCRDRPDKARIAAKLGLEAFVDDRLDVLTAMPDVPLRLCFDPAERDLAALDHLPVTGVTVVRTWADVITELARLLP